MTADRGGGERTAVLVLVAVTALWGSSFPFTKELIGRIPVDDYLGLRFLLAAAVLLVLRPGLLRQLTPHSLRVGVGLGILYGAAQLVQFEGLTRSSPTVAAFVVSLAVVFTPLIGALVLRHLPDRRTVLATAVATLGVGVLSLRGLSLGSGEVITAVSAAMYAVHVLALGRFARRGEVMALTFVQFATMGVLCTALGARDGVTLPRGGDLGVFLYLALGVGMLTLLGQGWAQSRTDPHRVAVLLVLEPVWAAVFAAVLWHHPPDLRTLVGGALVVQAMVLVAVPGVWSRSRVRRTLRGGTLDRRPVGTTNT
ncbi:DMT family transporter [Nocardioides maradonensis]